VIRETSRIALEDGKPCVLKARAAHPDHKT
jgi:hypothetical protein